MNSVSDVPGTIQFDGPLSKRNLVYRARIQEVGGLPFTFLIELSRQYFRSRTALEGDNQRRFLASACRSASRPKGCLRISKNETQRRSGWRRGQPLYFHWIRITSRATLASRL